MTVPNHDIHVDLSELVDTARTLSGMHAEATGTLNQIQVDAFSTQWAGGKTARATRKLVNALNTASQAIEAQFDSHISTLDETGRIYAWSDGTATSTVKGFFAGRVHE